ncbi:MAG TPA: cyclase family protein [Chloroflexota bacterium]|nr:cyclase family protein [Chloroflexota bacterium]
MSIALSESGSAADRGALARIGAAEVLGALRLPQAGRVYDLGLEINESIPPGPATPFSMAFRVTPEGTGVGEPYQFTAEVIHGNLHCSTHIDALIHVQAEGRIYGGGLASEWRDDTGWKRNGMETVAPIIGRCVVLDVAALKGVAALADGYEVTVADLDAACRARGVAVQAGDIVLVRTGKVREFFANRSTYGSAEPGVGPDAAAWLYDRGMAVLGTDTTGTEPLPFPDPSRTTHRAMLMERGVHLIENLYLDEIAADGVPEALFVCLPLKITGATGSWVRPVAAV